MVLIIICSVFVEEEFNFYSNIINSRKVLSIKVFFIIEYIEKIQRLYFILILNFKQAIIIILLYENNYCIIMYILLV